MKRILLLALMVLVPLTAHGLEISTGGTNISIGTTSVANALSVQSTLAVGSATYTSKAAPANGVIIQGNVGIGTFSPISALDMGPSGCITMGGITKCTFASPTGTWIGTSPGPIYYNTGNVGIGTFNPLATLAIQGSSGQNILNITSYGGAATLLADQYGNLHYNSDNYEGLYFDTDVNHFALSNQANQPVLITSGEGANNNSNIYIIPGGSGNIGIGTSSTIGGGNIGMGTNNATSFLTVNGAIGISNGSKATIIASNGIELNPTGSHSLMTLTGSNNFGIGSYFPQGGDNVGIGTSHPGVLLDVASSVRAGVGSQTMASFIAGTDNGTGIYAPQNSAHSIGLTTNGTERVRIDQNGNVGVDSTAPGATVDVVGNIRATGAISGASYTGLTINTSLNTAFPYQVPPPYTCTTNYYVNPSVSGASDSNNGTSLTTPFLTINGALTAIQAVSGIQGGTCLNVSPGSYNEASVSPYNTISGTRNWTYAVSSANASIAATYTSVNGITFTVSSTISGGTTLTTTTSSAYFPNAAGTLTKVTCPNGSCDNTITYSSATAGTINYFTIRSTQNRQAIIQIPGAHATDYSDCFRFDNSNFWGIDGFVCGGQDSVADSNDTGVTNNGSNSFDSHVFVINGTWNHLGAAGIGVNHFDYLTVAGNIVYHNADQNYLYNVQGSGISSYQSVASDGLAGNHNLIYDNLSYLNFIGSGNTNAHSDGNGIIIDDNKFTQNSCTVQPELDITASGGYISSAVPHSGNAGSGCQVGNVLIVNQSGAIAEFIVATLSGSAVATVGNPIILNQGSGFTTASAVATTMAYAYSTLIQNNVVHDNGGAGIHTFSSANINIDHNTEWNDYTDLLNTSTNQRAGINCSITNNCTVTNNIAVTNPYIPGSLGLNGGNTACGDYSSGTANTGNAWDNNDCFSGINGNSYFFFGLTGNATQNSTYTNTSGTPVCTFTIVSAETSGNILQTTGTCAPPASGSLTKQTGTGGSTTINYTSYSNTFSFYTLNGNATTYSNNIGADPGFLNPVSGNFRLNVGSPAIGVGTNTGITQDMDGKYIIPGAGYDMGAYQSNTIAGQIYLAQNVGIGSTYPQSALDLGSGGLTLNGTTHNTWPVAGFWVSGNVGINTTSNVGIGSTNPGQLLDIQGTMRSLGVTVTGTTNGCATWSSGTLGTTGSACGGSGSSPGGGQNAVQYGSSGSFTGSEAVFSMNGTNVGIGTTNGFNLLDVRGTTNLKAFDVTSFGNIGIGTNAPTSELQVGTGANGFAVNTSGNITSIGNTTSATLSSNTFAMTNSGANTSLNANVSATSGSGSRWTGAAATNGSAIIRTTSGIGSGDTIIFQGGNAGATEIARMTGLGYVGIGTAAPGSALDVNGTLLNGLRFNGNVGIGTLTATAGALQIGTDAAQITAGTIMCLGTGNCAGYCTGTVVGDSCSTCVCLPK